MKLSAIAFLFALPVCAAAQVPGDSALIRALGELRPGQPIRVALLRSRWVGDFERVAGDTLYFGTSGQQPMAIRFSAVDTVWRRGSATGRLTLLGIPVLGLLGGALMGGEGIGMGIVAGAVGGAIVGSRTRIWHRIHP